MWHTSTVDWIIKINENRYRTRAYRIRLPLASKSDETAPITWVTNYANSEECWMRYFFIQDSKHRCILLLGCDTVWTKQKHRHYRLQNFIKQYNSSTTLCAAACRMQPNCSLYELAKSGDNVTCTLAADYDENLYHVLPHVTSFTRKEYACRLRGMRYFILA